MSNLGGSLKVQRFGKQTVPTKRSQREANSSPRPRHPSALREVLLPGRQPCHQPQRPGSQPLAQGEPGPGHRQERPSSGRDLRRGRLPALCHRRGQGPGLPQADSHPVAGLADGALWSRRGGHCRDWLWQDFDILSTGYSPHQCPAASRARRRANRPDPCPDA